MARRFINEFKPGETIEDQIFCLTQKNLRSTTSGSLYIHAVLSDKTGQVPGRMWQASEEIYKTLPQEGFIRVKGRAENYKGSLQFIIEGIRHADPEKVNIEDFLPQTDKDIDRMFERMIEILRSIKDKQLLFLIKQFVEDKDLMDRFKLAPAAVSMHHACMGGLLEHTLNILELALLIAPRYPQINIDLLLTGAFLHDIGKTRELSYDTAFKYTDGGQLIGHIFIGAMLTEQKSDEVEKQLGQPFPAELLQVLQHLILSHHGQREFGSPKLPMTSEAIVLHYLDNLDAKLDQVKRQIEKSDQTDPESRWTGYVRSLERPLFKGLKNDDVQG